MKWTGEVELRCFSEENMNLAYQANLYLQNINIHLPVYPDLHGAT
jgi:hypothetical protein